MSKVKLACFDKERVVVYGEKKFVVVDVETKNKVREIEEEETVGRVNAVVIKGERVAYVKGRKLVVLTGGEAKVVVQRESVLVGMDMSEDGSKVAVGDDYGKIYVIHTPSPKDNSKKS